MNGHGLNSRLVSIGTSMRTGASPAGRPQQRFQELRASRRGGYEFQNAFRASDAAAEQNVGFNALKSPVVRKRLQAPQATMASSRQVQKTRF